MTAVRFALIIVLSAACNLDAVRTPSGELTPEAIMLKVAGNQDRAEKLRNQYVYQQHILVTTRRTNGKLAREEMTNYLVAPTPDGVKKELKHVDGRFWHKHRYVDFHADTLPQTDSLDGAIVESFRHDFVNSGSKDGFERDLFPLTTEEQEKYDFKLLGEQTVHDRRVYRVAFGPKDKKDIGWAGEALIDADEFQPMRVFTKLSRRIPLAVRTLLGTDLPGLGFNVEYRRFDDGVWFPISFGTEFRLRAVFFINRDITVSLENSGFQRAHVESAIDYKLPR
ncbi:MAG: hypothetical protein ACJ74Z_12245 [Bryobacteraceae bacterium]